MPSILSKISLLISVFLPVLFASQVAYGLTCDHPDSLNKESLKLYCLIKGVEGEFKVPRSEAEVVVGTYNFTEGKFEGERTKILPSSPSDDDPLRLEGLPNRRLVLDRIEPRQAVNAVNAVFRMNFTGSHSGTEIMFYTNNDPHPITKRVRSNASSIAIPVKKAYSVRWTLRNDNESLVISDEIYIARPPVIAVGAFTVPVLPVRIIYEPPQGNQKRNSAKFTSSKVASAQVSLEMGRGTSTQNTKFSTLTQVAKGLKVLGKSLSSDKKTKKYGIAATLIGEGLGSASISKTDGRVSIDGRSIIFTETKKTEINTTNRSGVGRGDLFHYHENVRLVWLLNSGELTLSILDWGAEALTTADFLKNLLNEKMSLPSAANKGGLSIKQIQSLLNLSPTTSSTSGQGPIIFDSQRFASEPPIIRSGGGELIRELSHNITARDISHKINSEIVIEEFEKGWLGYLGLGVTEDKKSVITTATIQSGATTLGKAVSTTVTTYADPEEYYTFDVYYDRIFSTYAFQKLSIK